MLVFQPMPLGRTTLPFDDQAYLFELKYDGFRALVVDKAQRADHPAVGTILFDTRVDVYTLKNDAAIKTISRTAKAKELRMGKEGG